MTRTPLALLAALLVAVPLAFAIGYGTGQGAAVIRLPDGEIAVDPSPGAASDPVGSDNDGVLEVRIDAEGRLAAANLTYREGVGPLVLAVVNDYEGVLQLAIERDRGGEDPWFIVYSTRFEQGVVGTAEITVEQPGRYRVSVIPGDPPLEASTAELLIGEAAAP